MLTAIYMIKLDQNCLLQVIIDSAILHFYLSSADIDVDPFEFIVIDSRWKDQVIHRSKRYPRLAGARVCRIPRGWKPHRKAVDGALLEDVRWQNFSKSFR